MRGVRGLSWLIFATGVAGAVAADPPPPAAARPASDQVAAAPDSSQRVEPGLADRRRRYSRPGWQQAAMVPAYVLRAPFQVLNYPLEHYIVHKEAGPLTVEAGHALKKLNLSGVGFRIGGLGSGSGTGVGLLYLVPPHLTLGHPLRFSASTTYRGYDLVTASLDSLRWGRGRSALQALYASRPREGFFGLGPNSSLADQTTYELDETRVGVDNFIWLPHGWRFEFAVAGTHDEVGRGRDPNFPTVLEVFDPAQYAGLEGTFDYVDYGIGFAHDSRDVPTYARRGNYFGVGIRAADGWHQTSSAYTKYVFDAEQFVPLPGHRLGLAARVHAVFTDNRGKNGADIPIFRLETIGGSRTVRGYEHFRFTDYDALLANLEYRFPVYDIGLASGTVIDGALFFDFGTAVRNLETVQQEDMRSSAGVGMRLVGARGLVGRIDSAWTPEGWRYHASFRGTF